MIEVTYTTELVEQWNRALDAATTLPSLTDAVEEFKEYVGDVEEIVSKWDDATFADWRKALYMERHGRYMGDERAEAAYADVLMPDVLFCVQLLASEFHVPWGLAFLRMKDAEKVLEKNGYFYMGENSVVVPDDVDAARADMGKGGAA